MVWTCICGESYNVTPGEGIRCVGRGHSVYLAPAYFAKMQPKKEEQPAPKLAVNKAGQANLF